jgi:hypothetical protein
MNNEKKEEDILGELDDHLPHQPCDVLLLLDQDQELDEIF